MKKLLCCTLVLALFCGAQALAELGDRLYVANCNEYVTLREEPSTSAAALARIPLGKYVSEIQRAENGFKRVSYRGQTGYVLSEYLRLEDDYRGNEIDVTSNQRYNLNLFLSNFTEQGFLWSAGCYDDSQPDEAQLTEFAVEHCWFNRQNQLEWGDYFSGNNVRLSQKQIAPVVKKYFDVSITPSKSPRYIDYKNGYYYWEETGGHVSDGFACLNRVEKLSRRRYCVWFEVYGGGENWDNDVCYYTASQAAAAFPAYDCAPVGRAVIDVGDSGLDDRSDWHIERYAVNCD